MTKDRKEYQTNYFKGYVRKDRPVSTEKGIRKIIERVAKANGFEISENLDKIIRAKLLMCKEDLKSCPCYGGIKDPVHYCGSPACVRETRKDRHCHCNLFRLGGSK